MGIARSSGAAHYENGRKLPILTMKQIGDLAAWWKGKLREQMRANLAAMDLTDGQRVSALDDFERHEPSYGEVMRFGQSPVGIDRVIRISLGDTGEAEDLEALADPLRRAEIASMLLQLRPMEGQPGSDIADPFGSQPSATGGPTPPGCAGSTGATPGN
jgi:hypothetical protein